LLPLPSPEGGCGIVRLGVGDKFSEVLGPNNEIIAASILPIAASRLIDRRPPGYRYRKCYLWSKKFHHATTG